ncbi:MAG: hypothetical protein AMJ56_11800 [Anaerolineae bacterium SG8_19]|nr:MAG: hypothetical protein AMJ56_11800 [Anaerolineae bacterium SG8_19]
MCCALLTLVLLGPRIFGAFWWIFQPLRWQAAFSNFPTGLWWIWPILGIVFLPWTTIMYVIVAPGGVTGFDWVWLWASCWWPTSCGTPAEPAANGFPAMREPSVRR